MKALKINLNLILILILILTNNILLSQPQTKIPLKDFFKNPDKAGYRISPNGEYFSYLAPYENRLNIFLENLNTGESNRITSEKNRDIRDYFWGNDNTIVFLKDDRGDENFKLYSIDIHGNNEKNLTPFDSVTTQIIDDLEDSDTEIIIGLNKRNKEIFDAYRLNIETGEMILAAENPGNISGWVTDHDGKIRAATSTDGVNTSLMYRDSEDLPFSTILTTSFREQINPLFFTFDNKYIYASSNVGRDKSAIIKYDIKNGKEMEIIYENPDVDVEQLKYSEKRKVLTTIPFTTWKRERKFLDKETENIYNRINNELGNYEVVITDMNKNEDKFLIRTYSDRSWGSNYYYDLKTDKLRKLSDVSPWLDENEMAEMKPVIYTSRDGLKIHGYLTLPKGVEPKNLPVVINPHGGPWYRDTWGFNPEVQFLANRGYAILQMNFRGSTGYGRDFWEKSFKQWGKTMQHDISDGVKYLIDEGIANPKKIAIYGASYGGYATLSGLAFSPELYAAGVDYVGVSNLFTFMKTFPPYWKPYLQMMYEMVGDPVKDSSLLAEASPVFNVDKIIAPLFVAQGKMDPRVNIEESNQIVSALKKRGIDVPYMVKDNEGHGFMNEENRFDFYEAMEKFLAKHILNTIN